MQFRLLCLGLLYFLFFVGGSFAATPSALRIDAVVLRPMQEVEVPAQQTGILSEIKVEEGKSIERGQLLALLDDRDARLTLTRARIEHAQAEARANNEVRVQYANKSLEVARAELQRSQESIEKFARSISQSQLDVERLTVEKLILERQQAEHDLRLERFEMQMKQNEIEAARLRLEQHQVRAPFTGTVVLIRGRIGEWVEVGKPVMRLVAVDTLRAEGFLQAAEASAALVDRPVKMTINSDGDSWEAMGVLRFVSPEMDPVTRQVRVWAEVPNEDGALRPGQQGALEILPAKK